MTVLATAQDFCFDEMTYSPEETTFKLFAPANAKNVKVRIYQEGMGGKPVRTVIFWDVSIPLMQDMAKHRVSSPRPLV